MPAHLQRHHPDNWISPAFEAACGPGLRAGVVAGGRADQDDPPALALRDQPPADRPAEQERPLELDVDLEVPLLVRHVDDLVVDADASAVHQDVDPAEPLDGRVDHRVHLVAVADVGLRVEHVEAALRASAAAGARPSRR